MYVMYEGDCNFEFRRQDKNHTNLCRVCTEGDTLVQPCDSQKAPIQNVSRGQIKTYYRNL